MTTLAAQAVSVTLGGRTVVDGVSLAVAPGEVVALLGPNGSGKSSLLRAMAGLLRPSAGRVLLDGQPLETVARREAARRVGYLPQAARSDWPLTVRHVVELGRQPFLSPLRGLTADDLAAVDFALRLTGCLDLAERPVTALSGGERGRAMIARVLAGDPALLLLDEPVTGLDPRYQLELMTLLRGLAADGRGVLVILHDLGLAARFCDRVHLLRDGRTLVSGPARDVLTAAAISAAFAVEPLLLETPDGPLPVAWTAG